MLIKVVRILVSICPSMGLPPLALGLLPWLLFQEGTEPTYLCLPTYNFFSSVFTTEDENSDDYMMENTSRCVEKSDDSLFTREVNKLLKDLDVTKSPRSR